MFKDHTKRIFIVSGYTRDYVALNNANVVNFDFFLKEYLKQELNYQRVIFFDHKGIYFLDKESAVKAMEEDLEEERNEEEIENELDGLMETEGPGGGFTVTGATSEEQNLDVKLRYPALDNIDRIYHDLEDWLREDIKTAVIIYDDERLASDSKFYKQFIGELKTGLHSNLGMKNRNIIIFTYPEIDFNSFVEQKRPEFNFLQNRDNSFALGEQYSITAPSKDEIRNLINHYRLVEEKAIDWENIDNIINQLAIEVQEKRLRLKEVNQVLLETEAINLELLNKIKVCSNSSLDSRTGMEKLNDMIGMESLKKEIKLFVNGVERVEVEGDTEIAPKRFQTGQTKDSNVKAKKFHLMLRGNPGTGKTTVAKYVGEILREKEILDTGHVIEVGKSDLVAEHMGGTAIKTERKIQEAMGGVLFVDEAYSLAEGGENNYGKDALATLIAAMTDYAGQFVVIMAGYPNQMNKLYELNPGLKRRIIDIRMPDYTAEELADIFIMMTEKDNISLSDEVENNLSNFTANLYKNRHRYEVDGSGFGNAGIIENIITNATNNARIRTANQKELMLEIEDFKSEEQKYFLTSNQKENSNYLKELEQMVGLDNIKQELEEIKAEIKDDKERLGQNEIQLKPDNYIFTGNPGTGKTTVAKMMGQLLFDLGVLKSNSVKEVSAQQLVGSYQGHSQANVKEIFAEAKEIGGVLFIDEAHQFYSTSSRGDYNTKILQTMIPLLTKYKDDFTLIFAGYPEEIEEMLSFDVGLKDRFSRKIEFKDYNSQELLEIFKLQLKKHKFSLEKEAEELIKDKLSNYKKNSGRGFGNARAVENFFSLAKRKSAVRRQKVANNNGYKIKKIDLERVDL